jgi:hypothetical protein
VQHSGGMELLVLGPCQAGPKCEPMQHRAPLPWHTNETSDVACLSPPSSSKQEGGPSATRSRLDSQEWLMMMSLTSILVVLVVLVVLAVLVVGVVVVV